MITEQELAAAKEKYRSMNSNPLTPLNFLKRSVWAFPNKKAVVHGDDNYTWRHFADRVYQLTHALKEKGIGHNDRVAIFSRNNNAMLEAFYAIGLAGAVSVPLNYRLIAKEVAYILNHCEAKILLIEHTYAEMVQEVIPQLETTKFFIEIMPSGLLDTPVIGVNYEDFIKNASSEPVEVPVEDEMDMISIVYTSGTTGQPKGCVHTHRGAYLNALGEAIAARLHPDSSYLWTLPMFHCDGWNFVWAVTAVGGKHVCLEQVRADAMYELIIREKVTNMCGAPTVYLTLAEYMKKNYLKFTNRVKGFIAGAPPSPAVISESEYVGIEIVHVYGLSETYGPHIVCEWLDEWNELPITKRATLKARQGVPYPQWNPVRVVDDNMNDVPWDGVTAGEVAMKGNNVMEWYFKDHEKTDEAFRGGWFHSGDAAVIHPDGYLQIVDRLKDIIASGGEKVSGVEVEAVIAEHPAVMDVAVFGKPDPRWGEVVKALVQLKPGESVTANDIIEWCRDHLARFKVPKEVEFGQVPRTATGKVQKTVLKQKEREKAAQSQDGK